MRRLPLALAVLALAGCTADAPPRDTADPSRSPSPPAGASAGCGTPASPATTGKHTYRGRSYLLKLPDTGKPAPLVIDLHGLRSTAFQQALYGRVANTGAARGFIVVEPDSPRGGWKLPGMPDGSADITYIKGLIGHLERTLCVDRRRVYATGFSNGAGLAAALICGLDGRLAGVGAVAGLNLARPCPGAEPTTVVAFHGTADAIVPYVGGEPFGGDRSRVPSWMRPVDGAFALPPVQGVASSWADAFGCEDAVNRNAGGTVRRRSHPGCERGVRVDLYTVPDGGHTWPGALPIGPGRTTTAVDATDLILDAFSAPEARPAPPPARSPGGGPTGRP